MKANYIYSDSLNEMIAKGFTRFKFREDKIFERHYTWNDLDCVYYNDEVDGDYYMEIPQSGIYNDYKGEYRIEIVLD